MSGITIVDRPADPVTYADAPLHIERHTDCYFVPIESGNFWENKTWGIYDSNGHLIEAAAYYQLPNRQLTGQSRICPLDLSNAIQAPLHSYCYIGLFINHYGHFICSTMSRFWALANSELARLPFIGHGPGDASHWFHSQFAKILFNSAGITQEDFAHFREPVRLPELFIAQPSFHERNSSHPWHAEAGHRIGDRLTKAISAPTRDDILYMTKSGYGKTPDGFSNESVIASEFERQGITVYHPERYALGEQIARLREARCIVGPSSSAFHTALFFEARADQKFIQIASSPGVCSTNHKLIDYANRMNSTYVYFDGNWEERPGANPGFRISDPEQAACDLLRYVRDL